MTCKIFSAVLIIYLLSVGHILSSLSCDSHKYLQRSPNVPSSMGGRELNLTENNTLDFSFAY